MVRGCRLMVCVCECVSLWGSVSICWVVRKSVSLCGVVCLCVCACVFVSLWVIERQFTVCYIWRVSPSPWIRDPFPQLKDPFTYISLVRFQLNCSFPNLSSLHHFYPSPTHLILTPPNHTSHWHPNNQSLNSTLCCPTTLPHSQLTHAPTLFSLALRSTGTHSPSYLAPSNSKFNVLKRRK